MVKSSLFDVIAEGQVQQLTVLLNSIRNFDINELGPQGHAPLHFAVNGTLNTVEIVRLLVDKGANINRLNADGETPLIIATAADREDVVRALLDLGADIDAPARSGAVPLYYALSKRCRATLPQLLMRKPNVNFLTEDGESLLHAAVRFGDPSLVDAVLHGLRVYPGGRVLMPPLANGSDEAATASSGNNKKGSGKKPDDAEDYHRWTSTVSLLDARSLASWDAPIGIAVHNALNPAQSSWLRTRSTEVAQLLSTVRTDQLLEDHLDLPRSEGVGSCDFY